MSALESALALLATKLDSARRPYMVIGGLANLRWGKPRLTQDLDVTVVAGEDEVLALLAELAPEFRSRTSDPTDFVRSTSVLPVESDTGVPVDIVLARLELEREAVRRAVPVTIGGTSVRFATAEDLLLQKIVSERLRDREDAEHIVRRQRGVLDRAYLLPRLRELARVLDRADIVEEVERWLGE